jgi:hypothetical protein
MRKSILGPARVGHFDGSFDDDSVPTPRKSNMVEDEEDVATKVSLARAQEMVNTVQAFVEHDNAVIRQEIHDSIQREIQNEAKQEGSQARGTLLSEPSNITMKGGASSVEQNPNGTSFSKRSQGTRRESVALQELGNLTKLLGSLSQTIKEVSDKVNHHHAVQHLEEAENDRETLVQRLMDNNLRAMFVGHEIVGEEVDNVVNTLTLMNALILTIPYSLMSNMNYDYWDQVIISLDNCSERVATFESDFAIFKNSFNAVVYSAMASLIMSLIYYLLKPKNLAKFRKWWKQARYVIIMMLCGTVCSVVSLVAVSCWLFAWYNLPSDQLCEYNSQTNNIVGIAVLIFTSAITFYLMI